MSQPISPRRFTETNAQESGNSPNSFQGFSIQRVTWGYRELFTRTIEALFEEGRLGPERQAVTTHFFNLLKRADQSCYDHVLHQFIKSLSPQNRWIMDLPAVFVGFIELGAAFAEQKLHYGIRFFEAFAEGAMGQTPEQVRDCLAWLRLIRKTDDAMAISFLQGYPQMCERMRPPEISRYVNVALEIHSKSPGSAAAFLRGELASSETYILQFTQEAPLADVAPTLATIMLALTGAEVKIESLAALDSDYLIELQSNVVACKGWLYLPKRVRFFQCATENRAWYMLATFAAAALALHDAFPNIHGKAGFKTSADIAGSEIWRQNIFAVIEYLRALRRMTRSWPGARSLLTLALAHETFALKQLAPGAEHLLQDALDSGKKTEALQNLRNRADSLRNCFDTAGMIAEIPLQPLLELFPALALRRMRAPSFLPDFNFPLLLESEQPGTMVADLKTTNSGNQASRSENTPASAGAKDKRLKEQEPPPAADAAFVYDEWDFRQNNYRPAWCKVRIRPVSQSRVKASALPSSEHVRAVRAVFERLRPTLAHREKYLEEGDCINEDRLVEFFVDVKHKLSPTVRFYDKPLVRRRDLAALILLDVSGSTGNPLADKNRTLDFEQQAALLLGSGLAALDDRFAIAGFNSNGRVSCNYYLYKRFDDAWNEAARMRIIAATPGNSTRIGPALRHSGKLLANEFCRQRLIMLITDGKPTDQAYDPDTGYAQHDVRMACEENLRQGVNTFAISTTQNSLGDMQIMFSNNQFLILDDIRRLPVLLPRIYLHLTA